MLVPVVLLLGVSLLGACASDDSTEGADAGGADSSRGVDQVGFVEMASRGGDNLDEDPILFSSIDAMLDRTDVAVVGEVASVRPGRSIPVGRSDLNTFTFEIAVDRVLYGDVKPDATLVFEWYLDSSVSQDDVASVAPGDRLLVAGRLVAIDVEGARRHAESLYGDSAEVLFPWNQAFIAEAENGEVIDAGSSEPAATALLFGELSFEETVERVGQEIEKYRSTAPAATANGQ
jgi:ABC-type amino acid transport substrate-binding protein